MKTFLPATVRSAVMARCNRLCHRLSESVIVGVLLAVRESSENESVGAVQSTLPLDSVWSRGVSVL